jgi:hypothetical protein
LGFIDSHTHAYLRGSEDLQLMASAGVEGLVLCSYFPIKPTGPSTLIDLYRWLMEEEPLRMEKYGLKSVAAVGIHPRSIPTRGVSKVMACLGTIFESGQASVLGEVGLESGDKHEEEVFFAQLQIAAERSLAVIIHTPRENKSIILEKTIALLEKSQVDMHRIILDHLTPELVPRARSLGVTAGITVQPGKTSAEEVGEILLKNGPEGLVVNSDLGNVSSNPLALPQVARYLDSNGFTRQEIEMVTRTNIRSIIAFQ